MNTTETCTIIWSALSAIGTIAASVIALWLGLRDHKKHLECALVWDGTTNSQPTLVINNPGRKLIVLKEITIIYKARVIQRFKLGEEFHLMKNSAISPNEVRSVNLPHLEKFNLEKIGSAKSKRLNTLKVELKDISGKKYTSRQRVSDDEVYSLLIGQTMLSD